MSNMNSPYMKLIQGAGAGLVATLPMTLFMRSAWKHLPASEQYPLPPRQITKRVIGLRNFWRLSGDEQTGLTLLFHFLFGAAAGSVYGMVEEKIPVNPAIKGPLAGMAVWTGSYLGWVPALGILPPATEHPWRRNLMMIVAHLIWGMTLGALARVMDMEKTDITLNNQ